MWLYNTLAILKLKAVLPNFEIHFKDHLKPKLDISELAQSVTFSD